jgi:phospholipid N-methyltransferase
MVAVSNPALVGAVVPSSRRLAGAMADAAAGAALLIDLGAGTGAITAALRERYPDVPLVAVEMQRGLAQHLRDRFAGVDVRCVSAHEALPGFDDAPADAIAVSSLPFRSLPAEWRRRTIAAIESFLLANPERRLVQYTYQPRAPFEPAANCLRWRHVTTVWRNAPPAGVWTLQRA